MVILLLEPLFDGAYGSLKDFIIEIKQTLIKMKHQVFISNSVESAVDILEQNNVEMSIGVGKYNFYVKGSALYDIYHITHYQWIIDNPYKMQIDSKSNNIKYILIDYKFELCMGILKNKPLFLPLGVMKRTINKHEMPKEKGLVFAGQIRNVDDIYNDIKNDKFRNEILDIVEYQLQDLNTSFIDLFERKVNEKEYEQRREIFRLSNSYIRAYKRENVLSSIFQYPIYVIGDNCSKRIANKKNITFLGKAPYSQVNDLMKRYYYSLNIEPNFNDGFHDRVLRSINSGNVVVTNFGVHQCDFFEKEMLYYNYGEVSVVEEQLEKISTNKMMKMNENARRILEQYFSWEVILQKIIDDHGRKCK